MNVLVVTNDFPPKVGGVNYYVSELVRRFPPGTTTVFASTWPNASEFDKTFPQCVVRWPTRTLLPTPSVCAEAVRLAREVRADIVLCGASLPLAFVGQSVSRRCGIPYVACTHGLELAAAKVAPGRAFLRRLFKDPGTRALRRRRARKLAQSLCSQRPHDKAVVPRCAQWRLCSPLAENGHIE